MTHAGYSTEEIARRGKEIYEQHIRALVEKEENWGKLLLIDIETGEYEMDEDEFAASQRAHARHPNGAFFGLRVGLRSSGTLGISVAGIGR